MRKWLAKLMVGRYGVDPLTNFLLIVSMVILLVATLLVRNSAVHSVLFTLAVALLVIGYYRIFSRKTSKRYEENQKYLRLRNRLTGRLRALRDRLRQSRTHRFFKCPECGVTVRVPKGKGKIKITCPKCRATFVKNT
ncbi:MAG TPA: hypothetical protein IAD24_00275 [Candidatus Aphodomorpha intestinavium]|uniref:Zn-finger containing protein n=1 Tax=Candidatus Aphodomorpha intestinavium TaxID=2840672 RepID=A0A9D1N1V3_9FIRM|nr:hypothetical protein [Candidatus Aphodomorpha intestinavium]